MSIKNRIITACFLVTVGASSLAGASLLGDNLGDLFLANSTAPTTISNSKRVGVSLGSVSLRTPIRSVNLFSFDPPRFSAGCAGMDMHMGSFSFISGAQLTQVMREIASHAGPLLFKAVIKGTAPHLDGLIEEFKTMLNQMNSLLRNTCAVSNFLVDGAAKGIESAVGGPNSHAAAAMGALDHAFSSTTEYLQGGNAWIKNKIQKYSGNTSGNNNLKALQASDIASILGYSPDSANTSDPNHPNIRLIISLIGYQVNGVVCRTYNKDGTVSQTGGTVQNPTTTSEGKTSCTGSNLIVLDDLIIGGGNQAATSGPHEMLLYRCMNPEGTRDPAVESAASAGKPTNEKGEDFQICTDMKPEGVDYEGVRGYINRMLYGDRTGEATDPASIMGLFDAGANITLDANQARFVHVIGGNLVSLLQRSSDQAVRRRIANNLSKYMESCVLAEMGTAIYKTANQIETGHSYKITDDAKKNIIDIRNRRDFHREVCNKSDASAKLVAEMLDATRLNSPH